MIQTTEDVRTWAKTIVDANGEKFTPLTKGDQYAIAKFIMDLGCNASRNEYVESPKSKPNDTNPEDLNRGAVRSTIEDPVRTVTMTRAYAYHRAGFKAQEVYDKFLKDVADGNATGKVMDFSTGRQSTDGAFAFWLSETIEVDLPSAVRKC